MPRRRLGVTLTLMGLIIGSALSSGLFVTTVMDAIEGSFDYQTFALTIPGPFGVLVAILVVRGLPGDRRLVKGTGMSMVAAPIFFLLTCGNLHGGEVYAFVVAVVGAIGLGLILLGAKFAF